MSYCLGLYRAESRNRDGSERLLSNSCKVVLGYRSMYDKTILYPVQVPIFPGVGFPGSVGLPIPCAKGPSKT